MKHKIIKNNIKIFIMTFLFLISVGSPFYSKEDNVSMEPNAFRQSREAQIVHYLDSELSNVDIETGIPWGIHDSPKGYHSNFESGTRVRSTRSGMNRAMYLLASPRITDQESGRKLLKLLLSLQDTEPTSPTFGVWPWYYEEPLAKMAAVDYNWADFQGSALVVILSDNVDRLDPDLQSKTRNALEYAVQAIIKRNVQPGYTNIAMKGAVVAAAAGEILHRPDFLDYGRMRIKRNWTHFLVTHSFTEYNSPTYQIVVLHEMEAMLQYVRDSECRETAKSILQEVWRGISEHYHVTTSQWGGPHFRAYSDLLFDSIRDEILARVGNTNDIIIPNSPLTQPVPCPEEFRTLFTLPVTNPVERKAQLVNRDQYRNVNGVLWMNSEVCLGTASYHTFWMQTHGLIGYLNGPDNQPGCIKLVFEHNGQECAAACAHHLQKKNRILSAFGLLHNRGSMHPTFDRPKDAVFKAHSFKIIYRLEGTQAQARQLNRTRFELTLGNHRIIIHTCPDSRFDGHPLSWQVNNQKNCAEIIGVCYEGKEKSFDFKKMETPIATALELLSPEELPSDSPIELRESRQTDPVIKRFYEVCWDTVCDATEFLIAPLSSTTD